MSFAGYIEAVCVVPASTTLSATNGGGGPTTVTLTAGSYYMTGLVSHLETVLNAQRPGSGGATWTVSLSTAAGGTGLVAISMSSGTFSITWSTATLGTMLGHSDITTQTSVTGATAIRGLCIPDRPLNMDDDPRASPMLSDLRETESPTGYSLGLVGNVKYTHTNLRWARVDRTRYLDTDSGVTPSWERFVKNTQIGQGHSWFTPRSRVQIVDHTGAAVGSGGSTTEWWMRGVRSVTARKMNEAWTGAWLIEIPAIVSDGSTE